MPRQRNKRVKSPYEKYCDANYAIHNIVATNPTGIIKELHNTFRAKKASGIDRLALKASYSLFKKLAEKNNYQQLRDESSTATHLSFART